MISTFSEKMEEMFNYIMNYDFLPIIKTISVILVIYLFINFLITYITMYYFFRIEELDNKKALIPFYNFMIAGEHIQRYKWLFVIPPMCIFAIYGLPYNIMRAYRQKENKSILSVISPIFLLLFLMKNKEKSKYFVKKVNYFKVQDDIQKLEEKLTKDEIIVPEDNEVILNPDEFGENIKKNELDLLEEKLINNQETTPREEEIYIDPTLNDDELSMEHLQNISGPMVTEDDYAEDLDSLLEEKADEKVNVTNIDKIVDNNEFIEVEASELDADKTIKEKAKSDSAIAFGGKSQQEQSTTKKKDMTICPKCHSSLLGATLNCPGCGTPIKELFKNNDTFKIDEQ